MRWTYDPSALYTILCLDEGKPNDNDHNDSDADYQNKKRQSRFNSCIWIQINVKDDSYNLTGIPDLQPPNLQYIHWMVSNVPGDRV